MSLWNNFQNGGVAGDGYANRATPHTEKEVYVGLSVALAAEVQDAGHLLCLAFRGLLFFCSKHVQRC